MAETGTKDDEKKVDEQPPCNAQKQQQATKHVLCWIDLELTGLDHHKDTIVEIAVILTDVRLKWKTVGPNVVIKTAPEQLSPWCTETFQKNGLFNAMQEADSDVREAETKVLNFLKAHISGPGIAHLAGSSVHVDRLFLIKHMPKIVDFLHYRIVDVSSLSICAWSWCPNRMRNGSAHSTFEDPPTDNEVEEETAPETVSTWEPNAHRAMWDLEQSIMALRYLRDEIYKPDVPSKSEHKQKVSTQKPPLIAKRPTKSKVKKPRF